jgi:UDP-N-acetylmuramate--alanine ligase
MKMKNSMQHIRYVYLLGIGGIGMSALARYFKADGKVVSGYDKTPTPLTQNLSDEGIEIHFEDDVNRIPVAVRNVDNKSQVLVILTPAVPADHSELAFFKSNGYEIAKRSKVLGMLTADHFTLAVAGTHGKTTTSTLLAHILHSAGLNCSAFLGGISTNFGSNLLIGDSSKPDHKVVVEADEFDRSFLTLFPDLAIITSMDADHLDIYGDPNEMQNTYRAFAAQVKPDGMLLHKKGLEVGNTACRRLTYSIKENESADFKGENIRVENGAYKFTLETPSLKIEGLTLGLPGRHNVENAVAASGLALECGVKPSYLKVALASFKGAQRRFEVHVKNEDVVYIDDYAHHPEELRAAISSARELFPDKKIAGIFQPHLYSRTRDFADGFAESLSLLDTLYMIELYPAREKPIPGVDSQMILDKVSIADKQLLSREDLLIKLKSEKPQVLLTLGAGDIDQLVKPIAQILSV